MKIILADATGVLNTKIVRHLCGRRWITEVIVLSTTAEAFYFSNKKLTYIPLSDFSALATADQQKLRGAAACIWQIGNLFENYTDLQSARAECVQGTLDAARYFIEKVAPTVVDEKFRFIYCSDKRAEWDEKKHLFFNSHARHLHGEIEKGLCELNREEPNVLELVIARPGHVVPIPVPFMGMLRKLRGTITMNQLARCVVDMLSTSTQVDSLRVYNRDELLQL